jgi:hypothetical protein
MVSLNITIKQGKIKGSKIVQFSLEEFERLAASFGMINPEIIKRINKAERDVRSGKIRKINSLKDLD